MTLYGDGDEIRGDRIVLCARKMSKVGLVNATGEHKAQQIVGTINARAWIERPLRAVLEMKTPGAKATA